MRDTLALIATVCSLLAFAVSGLMYIVAIEKRVSILEVEQKYSHGDLGPYLAGAMK